LISNRELAEGYLEDAEYSLNEAEVAYKKKFYHRVVRRCQECVELSLKAVLRLYGAEYPKSHDVSGALIRMAKKFPKWFRKELNTLTDVSTALVIQRAPSFYGDELRRLPPKRIYRKKDAEKALKSAGKVLSLTRKLLLEWARQTN